MSHDGCETGLMTVEGLVANPQLLLDTEGGPMIRAKEFDTEDGDGGYDEACAIYERWRDTERAAVTPISEWVLIEGSRDRVPRSSDDVVE